MRIFVTEEQIKGLKDKIGLGSEIISDFRESPLYALKYMPNTGYLNLPVKMLQNRFFEIRNHISQMPGFKEFTSVGEMKGELIKLYDRIRELEHGHEEELEQLALDTAVNLFKVPNDGDLKIKCAIVKGIKPRYAPLVSADESVPYTYDSAKDANELFDSMESRMLMNILVNGGTSVLTAEIPEDKLREIDPSLPMLYARLVAISDLLLYTEQPEFTEDNLMQSGIEEVVFNPEGDTVIYAQGLNFIILYQEIVKGLMEVFASHGLPDDKEKCEFIMANTDYLNISLWYERFGVPFWNLFTNNNDIDPSDIPYWMMDLSKCKGKKFIERVHEILLDTNKGKSLVNKYIQKASRTNGYSKFVSNMEQKAQSYRSQSGTVGTDPGHDFIFNG